MGLITLAAFAADLRRITESATEPMLGEIRLQWWRDSLDAMQTGGRVGAPLANALGDAIAAFRLPVPLLIAMTEARAFDLYDDPMADAAALEGYLAKTEAIPFELALRILGVTAGDASALARPAGRAYGMTRLLARLPVDLARGHMPVPLPVPPLGPHDVTHEVMLAGKATPAVRDMIATMSADISNTLATLRPQIAALSKRQRVAMLPLAMITPYLTVIGAGHRNPLRDIADLAPLTRVWRSGWAHLTGLI